jgi:hypothetical protein
MDVVRSYADRSRGVQATESRKPAEISKAHTAILIGNPTDDWNMPILSLVHFFWMSGRAG